LREESRLSQLSLMGSVLAGRYEVIQEIGRGALGMVYLAKQRMVDRPVAVKVLYDTCGANSDTFLRFQREAQALSALNHPNIVVIFDFGLSEQGFPFLVMDYIRGTNLRHLIAQEVRLDASRAVPMFIQIADALSHAHARDILHRDLKPDNVVLTMNDSGAEQVKLIDFGLAKRLDEARTGAKKLTMEGQVLGTPAYMSPEQIMGGKLDGRSDVYSMGCLMFNTLTGALPICGTNEIDTMQKHITSEPLDFDKAAPDAVISQGLRKLIQKSLKKHAQDRQQSMAELVKELEWYV
ncbi:MAG TPA: serine/threonine-protein kinase, partial [Candidatus Melainabacteria bacterium]|nr:serine/threonine-protein kinase [Candidatus Melainabacteria bacterium]